MNRLLSLLLVLVFILFSACSQNISQEDSSSENSVVAKSSTTKSSIPLLGLLVNYNNVTISANDTLWSDKLFGFNEGQLNNYYSEASNSSFKFTKVSENSGIENDGIVSIHLNKNHPNTDIDSPYFIQNTYPDLKNALIALDEYVDFSNYDEDANGAITPDELIIVFIIAGYEDAYEGRHVTNGVWAHQNCMNSDDMATTLDGVSLMECSNNGNFAMFGEKHDISDPHNATIGIIAHELGHATFNLPDLYNTSNPNRGGIGYFGIMGSGTWGSKNYSEYAGETPTHFCAWSKLYNGWIEPQEILSSSATLIESASNNYNIIKIPINTTSYYLLENRNNSGYDRGLYSLDGVFNGGIAIWKIDETKLTQEYINNNSVNANTQYKGVDLVEAVDGYIDSQGDGGNENALYYEGNVNSFTTLIDSISQRGSAMTLNIH